MQQYINMAITGGRSAHCCQVYPNLSKFLSGRIFSILVSLTASDTLQDQEVCVVWLPVRPARGDAIRISPRSLLPVVI